ncbi:hypothetical protein EDB83DRAFT_2317380 [Lactarius deliciosus]|nr:hypothetical protein EDB83DRAFT_2317380 [Lactarius deliciosus]
MTFEATLTKVSRPFEHAFLPTVRKPSHESESLSGTVGPLPLLDTPSALPLPACSYGPLHRAQEDSDLPPALGKRRGPPMVLGGHEVRDAKVFFFEEAAHLLLVSQAGKRFTATNATRHQQQAQALAGCRGPPQSGLRYNPFKVGAHLFRGTLGGKVPSPRQSDGCIKSSVPRGKNEKRLDRFEGCGRQAGTGRNNEHIHREQPDGASRLLAKGGVWIEWTTENRPIAS